MGVSEVVGKHGKDRGWTREAKSTLPSPSLHEIQRGEDEGIEEP